MEIYNYTAKSVDGRIIKGSIEAENENNAYRLLKQKNQIPIKITVQSKDIFSQLGIKSKKVSPKSVAVFARQFATIIRAGVPIVKCLDILRKQAEEKKFESILNSVYQDVQKGISLSRAMQKHEVAFSPLFVSMVEVGEISGTLDNSLEKMANQLEKDLKLRKKISGALTYPICLAVIAVLAVIVLMVFVVPQFKTIFETNGSELPLITTMLIGFSDSVQGYWYIYLAIVLAIVIGLRVYLKTSNGKLNKDKILLKIPVISDLQKKTITAKFARVSATMLSSGVSLLNTIEASEKVVGNVIAEDALKRIKNEVTKGGGLKGPIAREPVFPMMLSHMVGVGEESGSLDEMLEKTADFFEDEVDATVGKISTLVEPAILLFMAVVIGGIVLAIMIPMMSMSSMY